MDLLKVPDPKERRKGHGKKALKALLSYADKCHASVNLYVIKVGGTMSEKNLKKFYEAYGFKNRRRYSINNPTDCYEDNYMLRKAR